MTRLAASVSATDQGIRVDGSAFTERLPYRIVIDDEAMLVTGHSQDLWLVRRGLGGSDPVAHAANAEVRRAYALYGTSSNAGLSGGGPHDHDGQYATDDHTHATGDHPDLASHESLGLAAEHAHPYAPVHSHPYSADDHTHDTTHDHDADYSASGHAHTLQDADIPAGIARDSEVTAAIATHAATPHGGEGGGVTLTEVIDALYPVGHQIMEKTGTNPGTRLTGTTWVQVAEGLYLVGQAGAQAGGDEIGSATHAHGFTQPDAHAALPHAGATVADHAAQSHSAHAGATVGNHTFTQPNAHTDVPTHTHTTDSQGAHVHDEYRNSATTGGLDGWAAGDTSTNTPLITGYDTGSAGGHTHTASAPAGAVASQPHAGGAVDAHSVGQANAHPDHAALAHSIGQASQHGAQSHEGGAVADGTVAPPGYVVYVWERTA